MKHRKLLITILIVAIAFGFTQHQILCYEKTLLNEQKDSTDIGLNRFIDNALSKGEEYKHNYLTCDSLIIRVDSLNKELMLENFALRQQKQQVVTKNNWFTTMMIVVAVETINILLLILIK